jgi:predicted  nucleic acid-binding Zn-ribbon protein
MAILLVLIDQFDATVAVLPMIGRLARIQDRMSTQSGSSSNGSSSGGSTANGSTPIGSTPDGSTPGGLTASPLDQLEFPALKEFTELTYNLVEAIESSKRILQLNHNEIGALRESVRSLDLKLSTAAERLDASSIQSLKATRAEIEVLREGLGNVDLRIAGMAQQFDLSSKNAQQATGGEVAGLRENVVTLNGRVSSLAEELDASKREGLQVTSGEIAGLKESVASLNGRLTGLSEELADEQKCRLLAEAKTASLEEQIASGTQLAELDLEGLHQALVATRSQCLMLETQQQALAIKVAGLIKRADQQASPAPSLNIAGSAIATPDGAALEAEGDSASSDLLSRVERPQPQTNEGKNEGLSPSARPAKPLRVAAATQPRRSAKAFPLFVGGVAASALLGSSLVFIDPDLFGQPEAATPAKTVPQTREPLPAASSNAAPPPGPAAAINKPAPPGKARLSITCPGVCWVEVRRVADGKMVYDNLLKGSVQFAIGNGLKVSSGRSDILKLRINDGAPFLLNEREMLSSRLIKPPS